MERTTGCGLLMTRFDIYNGRYSTEQSDDKSLKLLLIQLMFSFESEGKAISRTSWVVLSNIRKDLLGGPG